MYVQQWPVAQEGVYIHKPLVQLDFNQAGLGCFLVCSNVLWYPSLFNKMLIPFSPKTTLGRHCSVARRSIVCWRRDEHSVELSLGWVGPLSLSIAIPVH